MPPQTGAMMTVMSIGVQGMRAAETRVAARASNVVNALSRDYAPLLPEQVEAAGGPVTVIRRASSPQAVDLANEMVDMRVASHAYRAAAAVVRTGAAMQRTLLDALT